MSLRLPLPVSHSLSEYPGIFRSTLRLPVRVLRSTCLSDLHLLMQIQNCFTLQNISLVKTDLTS